MKHRIDCSVLFQWPDVRLISYSILCALSFIWARQCTLESLIRSEGNFLSYIRACTHNDIWIPHKFICSCTFHSVSKVSPVKIICPILWMPDVFSLKRNNDHFPKSTPDIWKSIMLPHKPSSLLPCPAGNCTSVPHFVNVDVPLVH